MHLGLAWQSAWRPRALPNVWCFLLGSDCWFGSMPVAGAPSVMIFLGSPASSTLTPAQAEDTQRLKAEEALPAKPCSVAWSILSRCAHVNSWPSKIINIWQMDIIWNSNSSLTHHQFSTFAVNIQYALLWGSHVLLIPCNLRTSLCITINSWKSYYVAPLFWMLNHPLALDPYEPNMLQADEIHKGHSISDSQAR